MEVLWWWWWCPLRNDKILYLKAQKTVINFSFGCSQQASFVCSSHSFGDVTIAGEGLQILTYAWHLLPLGSEGSLVYHVHLLWLGTSDYNGHLLWPVTLTLNAERLAVKLSLINVLTTKVCWGWVSNTQPSAWGATALNHCGTTEAYNQGTRPWRKMIKRKLGIN